LKLSPSSVEINTCGQLI